MSFGRSQTCHRRCLSYIIIYGNYHGTWWDTATPLCVALSHTLSHVLWALYIEAHARPICWIYTYTKLTVSMVTTYPSFFTMEPKDTIPSSYNGNTISCTNLEHCRLILRTLLKHLSKWGMAFLRVTGWLHVAQWIVRSSLSASACEGGGCKRRVWGV